MLLQVKPDAGPGFEQVWKERKSTLLETPGFIRFALLRGDGEGEGKVPPEHMPLMPGDCNADCILICMHMQESTSARVCGLQGRTLTTGGTASGLGQRMAAPRAR